MLPRFSWLVGFALWLSVAATWLPTRGLTSMTCAAIASALKRFIANWRPWVCNGFTRVPIMVLTLKLGLAYLPLPSPTSLPTSNQGIHPQVAPSFSDLVVQKWQPDIFAEGVVQSELES